MADHKHGTHHLTRHALHMGTCEQALAAARPSPKHSVVGTGDDTDDVAICLLHSDFGWM